MSLSERIEQINREIGATVESALADLRRDVAERVRASSEEIARHVEALTPQLPASFVAHEDLSPFAESLAREAAEKATREAGEKAAREAAHAAEAAEAAAGKAARESAHQVAAASRSAAVDLRDAVAALDRARSQAEILAALLREAQRFAGRAAVLLVRGGEMRGWAGQGFGDGDAALRDFTFTPSASGGWSRLAQGQSAVHLTAADCGELCSRIEAPLPHEGVLIPVVLRDRVAAGLYADRIDGLPALPAIEALQVLCFVAAQSIELLPFRERPFTPTLVAEEGLAFTPPPPPDEAPAPAAPEPQEAEIEAEPEPPAAEVEPEPAEDVEPEIEAMPDLPDDLPSDLPEVEMEAEPAPEAASPLSSEPPPESPSESLPEPSPEPSSAATVYQPIPREALRTVEEASQPAAAPASGSSLRMTTPMPLPPLDSANPDETVLMQRPGLREAQAESPAPAPTPLRSVPPPPPAPAEPPAAEAAAPSLSGIPEVKPPSGVEGPGWAFATSRVAVSPNEEAQHEEARRLARLLVSEIKLYNEEQVEEGRRKKDVYERLKEDIDRSRQMYEERVEPRILKSTDYFYQELVRILAAGDAKALGI
jgi:hypothetical protein